ncbi:hypothetical protein C7M84_006124 [Penaeus vannamei]|uniref:Uncharacterized protein n=1 Tax=Penaeus vannamei TaxID=6689 RepID=A0A3R7SU97_PENVA|nr:hypothetical protein C7M84_006124 [Penaeus vannamei]
MAPPWTSPAEPDLKNRIFQTLIFGSLFIPESYEEFQVVRDYMELHSLDGSLWIGLRHDVNYPVDIHGIEAHDRDNVNSCATMLIAYVHIHYEDCGASFDGKICKFV